MHIDPQTIRFVALAFLILMIYSSRATKGVVKQTPEGPSFGIKPLFAASRFLLLAVYVGFVVFVAVTHVSNVPWWVGLLMVAVIAAVLLRMPGTIVLTPQAIVQRFWFFKEKQIPYNEVMALQIAQAGRATRVMGANRVTILHSGNHSAAEEFRREMEIRTGKKAVM